ncbi:MGMT family protein [Patescibacteria group bacterium]|nr:MAG: MGMT family protein [Patescibacteria group bacterium]
MSSHFSPKFKDNFTERVLDVVLKIPKGKTMSYGEVAKAAGKAKAGRAVGRIMAQNKDKKIPCHRVIRSDGSLGGYNGLGASSKEKLLRSEGAIK